MASTHRHEEMDERFARHLRESRSEGIWQAPAGESQVIVAGLEYSSWFADGSGDAGPVGGSGGWWYPNIEEPWYNTTGVEVWDPAFSHWLTIPEDGLWRGTIIGSWYGALFLDAATHTHQAIETISSLWYARSVSPFGIPPETDDPGDAWPSSSIWGSASFAWHQMYTPVEMDTIRPDTSAIGLPTELESGVDYVHAAVRMMEVEDLAVDDEWFSLSFQGSICLERISDIPA